MVERFDDGEDRASSELTGCSSELPQEEENWESEAERVFVDGSEMIPTERYDKLRAVRTRRVV